jgi:N-acetylneuraminate synthase
MCGHPGTVKRTCSSDEVRYLDGLVRGVYARRDLSAGQALRDEDLYLAVPLQKGQLSCREIMRGQMLLADIEKDAPLKVEQVDSPYAYDEELKAVIYERGI